ncbi:M4 family metallopeptidase [Lacibacter sp. H375]|uniref:M4 family metallopeptidase n=1 Tax=Lacibacter sp. H375 TaxID=3133424 RepID=UPI0030BC9278
MFSLHFVMRKRMLLTVTYLVMVTAAFSQENLRQNQMKENLRKDNRVRQFEIDPLRNTPSFLSFKTTSVISQNEAAATLRTTFASRTAIDDWKQTSLTKHATGITVQKFQQYYRGIKVEHGQYMASAVNGRLQSLNGAYYEIASSFTTKPGIKEATAVQKAIAFVKPQKMAWQAVEEMIKKQPQHAEALRMQMEQYKPKGELVIVKDFIGKSNQLRLAYKFNIYAAEPLYRANVYVDAKDGRILLQDMIIKHADGTVQTRYAGQRTVKTKQVTAGLLGLNDPANGFLPYAWTGNSLRPPIINSSFFILHDETRGNGVMTFDMNAVGGLPLSIPALYSQATSFTDPDNNWGDGDALTNNDHKRGVDVNGPGAGGIGEAENDDIAFDAHWGAEMVYDYWKIIHGRLSFDNNNSAIKSFVHYGPAYDNAFWNGEVMTYGDGSGDDSPALVGFKPLTSLDVCGHEIGHGVCEFTANLVYEKESGAMNEGFSDIWAACVENYVLSRVDPTLPYDVWGIGEQIDLRAGRALRRMDNPNAEGNPDTYGGMFWSNPDCDPTLVNDYCGVHNNSGVLNHWFYQLVAGNDMAQLNDIGQTFRVKGIGFADAEKIAYLTELRLSPTATFAEARMISIQAAIELFGLCSPQHQSTTNAWHAVGVGTAFVSECAPSITFAAATSSTSEITGANGCGSQKTYTVFIGKPVDNGMAANVTITAAGTAANGSDYVLQSSTVSWSATEKGLKPITLFINGDNYIEGDETVVLNFTAPAGFSAGISSHTLTIADDDYAPQIGSTPVTLLSENFDAGVLPAGWNAAKGIAPNTTNVWMVGDASSFGNGNAAFISALGTGVPAYESATPTDVVLSTNKLDARTVSGLTVSFTFAAGGERDVPVGLNPDLNGDGAVTADEIVQLPNSGRPFDYGILVYSFDGVQYFDCSDPLLLLPQKQSKTVALPAILNGKEFYLGFRWLNDANAAFIAAPAFVVDDILVKASPKSIQTTAGRFAETGIDKNTEAWQYSVEDGKVLGKVRSINTDLGCTRMNISQAGNGTSSFVYGTRSDKTFEVASATTAKKVSYEVTMLFTNEELAAWGADLSTLKVLRTTSPTLTLLNSRNSQILTPVISNNNGKYYSVTVTADGFGKFYLYKPTGAARLSANGESIATVGVYPNPAVFSLQVNVDAASKGSLVMTMFDVNGKQVYNKSTAVENGRFNTRIDVSYLPAGTYLLQVKNAGNSWTQRVVVQH